MTNAELVEDVRVVNRQIGDDEIRGQQTAKHVDANVARLDDVERLATFSANGFERRADKLARHRVEVYLVSLPVRLFPERANDKSPHRLLLFAQ